MSVRKTVRQILFVIFCLCAVPTVAISGACLLLVNSLGPFRDLESPGILHVWSLTIAPALIASFIGWSLLSTFRPWIRGLLVALAMAPVVWIFWSSATPWMESEFYVAADYNPLDQKVYFVSTQEALIDDNPPALPHRVKAEMWLERINVNGRKRERLVRVPASAFVDVNSFPYRGGRCYATSRDVRLRFSPAHDKIAMEEYWGGITVINLSDKTLSTMASRGSTNEFRYDHALPFIGWWPDDEHLLLLLSRHRTWNAMPRDVIVSTPAARFQPEITWEEPPIVTVDAHGRYSRPAPFRQLLWVGTMGGNLIFDEDPRGVLLTPLDTGHLVLADGRPTPIDTCWNLISGPQSNRWLTSEGDIVDEQARLVKKLPNLHGGYRAERTPHAWCKEGIVITDLPVGLEVMNPDTGLTRTLLPARFNHRSRIKDQSAYESYRRTSAAMQKAYASIDRLILERAQKRKQDEVEAINLADGLARHDTNALHRASVLLWKDNDTSIITVNHLTAANWSEADDLVSEFILHGTNVFRQYRALQRVVTYCPKRFGDTLVQIASDLSSNNTSMLMTALPGLAKVDDPRVENALVNIAVNCPHYYARYVAFSLLYPRSRALYWQTAQQLVTDKEFMEFVGEHFPKSPILKQ